MRTPLYHQIFLILRNKILEGEYQDGALLPSEAEISAEFGVSRITATRAFKDLAAAGLVVRTRGRGTQVQYSGGSTRMKGSVSSLIDSLHVNGRQTAQLLSFDYVHCPPEVVAVLKLDKDAIVQRAVRTYSRGEVPFSYLTTYVPAHIGRSWKAEDLVHKPMIKLLFEAGVSIERGEQQISAILADGQSARALKVAVGSPLLRIARVTYTANGVPVEYLIALYPPDRYQFSMTLSKEADTPHSWE